MSLFVMGVAVGAALVLGIVFLVGSRQPAKYRKDPRYYAGRKAAHEAARQGPGNWVPPQDTSPAFWLGFEEETKEIARREAAILAVLS